MAMAEENEEFAFPFVVQGFHVYRRVWVLHVAQHLSSEREDGNTENRFAVAVVQHKLGNNEDSNARTTVGHLLLSSYVPRSTKAALCRLWSLRWK